MFKKHSGVKLESFIAGLVYDITQAQQALAKLRIERIERHFDKKDNGRYVPKNLEFELCEGERLDIAKYLFAHVNDLCIEVVKVRGCAKIIDMEEIDAQNNLSNHNKQAVFYVKSCDVKDKSFEIVIELGKKETSEAQQRLIQNLNELIDVYQDKPQNKEKKPD